MSRENVAPELKGNTLRVYWYLLQCPKNFAGPRQIQRELGFKSPALAAYHLDKLMELGLVEKIKGEYQVTEVVDVGVLKQFMKLGGFIVPRYVTYATMISVLFGFFLSQLSGMKLLEFGEADLNIVEPKSNFKPLIAPCSLKCVHQFPVYERLGRKWEEFRKEKLAQTHRQLEILPEELRKKMAFLRSWEDNFESIENYHRWLKNWDIIDPTFSQKKMIKFLL